MPHLEADPSVVTVPAVRRTPCSTLLIALLTIAVAAMGSLALVGTASAAAQLTASSAEQEFFNRMNHERTSRGLAPLANDAPLADTSRTWSSHMRSQNALSHHPNLAAVATIIEPSWRSVGENVGYGSPVSALHDAFMASTGHRANILKPAFNRVGVGVVFDGSTIWVTVRFLEGPALRTPPPPARGGPVTGDFDGDGREDVFVYGPGSATDELLLGKSDGTFAKRAVSISGYYFPVAGDLDGNGTDEIVWYGKGTLHDAIWRWDGTGFSSVRYNVDGSYVPYGGDFDGDHRGDVFWFGPGSGTDRISYGTATLGSFDTRTLSSIGGGYRIATGDLDGDGKTDAVLHQAGTASDALVYGAQRGVLDRSRITVDGDYRPVVGDLDGNEADDVVWYGVGTLGDVRWQMSGVRGQFTRVSASVSGTYDPEAGDFNGDDRDDVLWFTPSSAVSDTIWWGQSTGATASASLRTS